ncbi:MAG TPA: Gfo/Idh/MocA family oxidoreductase [Candidatus Olsenella excrementavium]|uniref:Gfo/Idh/MocA family oxidoreductase n=1 Tax=Candidatus Olsenella excrementavium TaxID=2838709 RepID=A0A9D1ZA04_9ACTN|nr:Gfo/Idh/MocA family oxidoreductase [Candidatus Olsenella excrementavium]
MKTMRVGYIGAGNISGQMAETIARMSEVENYAVAARDPERAREFAECWGFSHAYDSYEELLADPDVDLVYVALPHSHHHRWTIAALEAGHHVLCEKAFAANERQAREMIECARERGLLLAEAIWTRYMPSRKMIEEIVSSGEIGEVTTVAANLGYRVDGNARMTDPALAGGALLDLTVYPLNFASMVLGNRIRRITASMVPAVTGVDGQDNVMIEYESGQMASLFSTMYAMTDREGQILGTKGFITVENINNPQVIRVYASDGLTRELTREIAVPEQITGYEYELLSCKRAIEAGALECPEMPHAETLELMRQMDEIRRQFGVVFPFE